MMVGHPSTAGHSGTSYMSVPECPALEGEQCPALSRMSREGPALMSRSRGWLTWKPRALGLHQTARLSQQGYVLA